VYTTWGQAGLCRTWECGYILGSSVFYDTTQPCICKCNNHINMQVLFGLDSVAKWVCLLSCNPSVSGLLPVFGDCG
jgi:hypothetical protein